MGGENRCKISVSCSLSLMGVGKMSMPKEDPTGLDNVSYSYLVLDIYCYILDG